LPAPHIVELGIGPGYLAERLLKKISNLTYEGVDFSTPMLDLASVRLAAHMSRIKFTQADLITEDWGAKVCRPVGAIISTWALHDLGSEENTMKVYQACRQLLPDEGILTFGASLFPLTRRQKSCFSLM